jgi:site-specific recombinase XerD
MRRAELTDLKVEDFDFKHNVAFVPGKGRRPRPWPLDKKTAQARHRYRRARVAHRHSDRLEIWLARKGPLTASGVYQMVADRAKAAGVGHAHLSRQTFAHP